MTARILTFLVWALGAASAVFWGLRASGSGPSAPTHAVAAPAFLPASGDLRRVLGGDGAPTSSAPNSAADGEAPRRPGLDASRLKLLGVVAVTPSGPAASATRSREGLALLALDGKPARTYRAGATVEGDHVVQTIEARRVTLGPRGGEATLTLELPAGAAAAPSATPRNPGSGLPAPRPGASGGEAATSDDDNEAPLEDTTARPPRRTEPAVLRAPSPLNR